MKFSATTVSGAFLCIPAAVLALLSVILNAPGYLAIALIVFPRDLPLFAQPARQSYALPHIIAARATGSAKLRILAWHVLPVAGPQMIALAGSHGQHRARRSIPVEALCGLPGIGQLAWQAALSPRPSLAGEPDRAGYARNLAGKLRGRCNDTCCEASEA